MEIKKIAHKLLAPTFLGIVSVFVFALNSYAASGTISVVPASGTYQKGQIFTAAIKVDGGGTKFNAAKASVAVSQNLSVQSVTLGDCDFAFVNTPSIGSLAFAGVILGGSTDNCTVYTMNLKATNSGTGFVFLSDGSIRSYKGAEELLSKMNNSSYVFDDATAGGNSGNSVAAAPTPTQAPLTLADGTKLYTLVYNIDSLDKNASSLQVALDPGTPAQMLTTPSQSKDNPTLFAAIFENVPQGVHAITVLDNEKPVSKQIVNIAGQNREITLGVTPNAGGAGSLLWYVIIAVVMLIALTVGILGYVIMWRKRHPGAV